jgi:tetratricopeptide (TPR) repeat protein
MQNKAGEAEKAYEATLTVNPRAAVAANNLAWMFLEGNRNLDRALELAQIAKAGLPDDSNVSDTLGWIYYRKAMFPQALAALQESVERDQRNAAAQYHLGMTYVRLNDWAKGRTALKQALAIDPNFSGAAEARSVLQQIGD